MKKNKQFWESNLNPITMKPPVEVTWYQIEKRKKTLCQGKEVMNYVKKTNRY